MVFYKNDAPSDFLRLDIGLHKYYLEFELAIEQCNLQVLGGNPVN